jgi:hypothetical protein
VRGGLSRGGCDIRGSNPPDVREEVGGGRSEVVGFIVGGKKRRRSDPLWLLTRPGREPSLGLIETGSGDIGEGFACDARRVDGDRIIDNRLRCRLFPMVVGNLQERWPVLFRRCLRVWDHLRGG